MKLLTSRTVLILLVLVICSTQVIVAMMEELKGKLKVRRGEDSKGAEMKTQEEKDKEAKEELKKRIKTFSEGRRTARNPRTTPKKRGGEEGRLNKEPMTPASIIQVLKTELTRQGLYKEPEAPFLGRLHELQNLKHGPEQEVNSSVAVEGKQTIAEEAERLKEPIAALKFLIGLKDLFEGLEAWNQAHKPQVKPQGESNQPHVPGPQTEAEPNSLKMVLDDLYSRLGCITKLEASLAQEGLGLDSKVELQNQQKGLLEEVHLIEEALDELIADLDRPNRLTRPSFYLPLATAALLQGSLYVEYPSLPRPFPSYLQSLVVGLCLFALVSATHFPDPAKYLFWMVSLVIPPSFVALKHLEPPSMPESSRGPGEIGQPSIPPPTNNTISPPPPQEPGNADQQLTAPPTSDKPSQESSKTSGPNAPGPNAPGPKVSGPNAPGPNAPGPKVSGPNAPRPKTPSDATFLFPSCWLGLAAASAGLAIAAL